MQLIKYSPLHEIEKLEHEIDKLWENGFPAIFSDTAALDLYEEAGKLTAEIRLPHFKKEEVTISTTNNVLEIVAEHKEKEEKKDKRHYFLRESNKQFLRRIKLPEGAEGTKAEADFKDEILKITMPITESDSHKIITIK